jgi:hypothetical protein
VNQNSYDTLSQATDALHKRGFDLDFNQKGKFLECVQDSKISLTPEDFEIVEFHRFEGESNPSDMSVVYALEAKDGRRGVLIDAYGMYSDEYSPEMLAKFDIRGRQ